MKLDSKKILIIILLCCYCTHCSVYTANIFDNINTELGLGDECVLENNTPGTCQLTANCEYVKKKMSQRKHNEIKICGFNRREPIVCCPYDKPQDINLNQSPSNLTCKIKNTNQNLNNGQSKFQKALCKDLIPPVKLDLHIIGGEKAEVGEFKFQVALGYVNFDEDELEFKCGGSLIADDIIITAAHCVNKKDKLPVMARIGRTSLDLTDSDDDTEAQDIKIECIVIHPGYKYESRNHDIALVKLKKPADLSSSAKTICLSTKDDNLPNDFTITGFGTYDNINKTTSKWLLKAKVNQYPLEKCKNLDIFQNKKIKIINSQFCARSQLGKDTCQGDSGGPLFYEENFTHYLHAITSYGVSCGSRYPGVYTKVNQYLDWIETTMNQLE